MFDQMTRLYSVKAGIRRWPMHVFYIVVDMALINSWVPYKHVCQSNISRRKYIQKVAKELIGNVPSGPSRKYPAEALSSQASKTTVAKKRLTLFISKCSNLTTDSCQNCSKPVCGKCIRKIANYAH